MPAENRVGRDDGGNAGEQSAADDLAARRESAALIVGQAKSFLAELFLEDAVLLDEVLDCLCLVAVDPAGESGEEELEADEVGHVSTAVGEIGAVP